MLNRIDVDYPSATFPVTFASAKKDLKDESYKPINAVDKECYDRCTQSNFASEAYCR